MKINIYAKGIELTSDMKDYVEEKIGKLEKYLDNILETRVELNENTGQQSGMKYRCEVTMFLPKKSFRAEETTTDIFAAIDMVVPKIKRQIEVYKTKFREKKRGIKALENKI